MGTEMRFSFARNVIHLALGD